MAPPSKSQEKHGLVFWLKSETSTIVSENNLRKFVPHIKVGWTGKLPWTDHNGNTKEFLAKLVKLSADKKALEKIVLDKEGKIVTRKMLEPKLYQKKAELTKEEKAKKQAKTANKHKLAVSTNAMKPIYVGSDESDSSDSEKSENADDVEPIEEAEECTPPKKTKKAVKQTEETEESTPPKKTKKAIKQTIVSIEDSDSDDDVVLGTLSTSKSPGKVTRQLPFKDDAHAGSSKATASEPANVSKQTPLSSHSTNKLCDRCANCECRKKNVQASPKKVGSAVVDVKVELVKDSKVIISSSRLQNINLRAGDNMRALTRGLLQHFFSAVELAGMSAKGAKGKPPIPTNIRDAIMTYVRAKLDKPIPEEDFVDVINKTCQNSRPAQLTPRTRSAEKEKRRMAAKASREKKILLKGVASSKGSGSASPSTPRRAPPSTSPSTPPRAPQSASPRTPPRAPQSASPRTPPRAPQSASPRTPRRAPPSASRSASLSPAVSQSWGTIELFNYREEMEVVIPPNKY